MPGEFEIIARHFSRPARSALLGVGDDAALVAAPAGLALAVTTDMLLEGRHFARGADPAALGHKALAVNLSDLAAMGADPRWFTLALALPERDEAWLTAFARGLYALAGREGCELVGGDTTRGPLAIAITAIGTVPAGEALRRDAARPGDDLWLSGVTGEAALALAQRQGRVRLSAEACARCAARLDWPEARVALGRRLRALAHAAIDISDGLTADLGHVLERSGVGAEVEVAAIPRPAALAEVADERLALECLLAGGDDYELLFTAPPAQRDAVLAAGAAAGVPLACIGRIVADEGLRLRDAAGRPVTLARAGFDHFAA